MATTPATGSIEYPHAAFFARLQQQADAAVPPTEARTP